MKKYITIAFFGLLVVCSNSWSDTQIRVTVTTTGPVGLAPAFAAFHDGSYEIFSPGGMASAGLEALAEVGDASVLVGATPAGVTAAGFAPGGPFVPNGGTESIEFSVSDAQSSFSFAAMVLPSNDWFIGNGAAIDISSLLNAAPGTSINLSPAMVWDAGTEEEDFAFAPGGGLVGITTTSDPNGGAATSNPIALLSGADPFAVFQNIEPMGFDTTTIDFSGGPLATVSLTVVPEPTCLSLIGMLVLGIASLNRRRF